MIVYDLEGKEHDKTPIDARECVANCGWSFDAPVITPNPEDNKGEGEAPSLTVPQIKERLEAAGITIPFGAKKAELMALLPE